MAFVIGIHFMTLTHDEENIRTKVIEEEEEVPQKELLKDKVHMDIVNKGDTHSLTSFTNGISDFTSDFYQVSNIY